MTKAEKKKLEALDRQLDYWEKTDKEHRACVAKREKETKHDFDHFDHIAYLKFIYSNGHNKD